MVDHSSRKVHFPLTTAQIVSTACLFREVVVEVEAEEPHNCVRVRHTCHWHTQSKAQRASNTTNRLERATIGELRIKTDAIAWRITCSHSARLLPVASQ